MLPSNAYDEVYPRIYVGEESIGKSRVGLRDLGITHVVNTAMGEKTVLCQHKPRYVPKSGHQILRV